MPWTKTAGWLAWNGYNQTLRRLAFSAQSVAGVKGVKFVGGFDFVNNDKHPNDDHGHGTHVAGIIAGNGAVGEKDETGALYGLGVAPGASIVGQRLFEGAALRVVQEVLLELVEQEGRRGACFRLGMKPISN